MLGIRVNKRERVGSAHSCPASGVVVLSNVDAVVSPNCKHRLTHRLVEGRRAIDRSSAYWRWPP